MSLLLDALRRAAASREAPEADRYTVPRRAGAPEADAPVPDRVVSAPDASDAPGAPAALREDDLALVPPDDGSGTESIPAQGRGEPAPPPALEDPAARGERSAAAGRERDAADALLQAGAAARRGRGALVLGLVCAALVAAAALAGGGWLWYQESRNHIADALGGYRPQLARAQPRAPVSPSSDRSTPAQQAGPAVRAHPVPPASADAAAIAAEPGSSADAPAGPAGSTEVGANASASAAASGGTADDAPDSAAIADPEPANAAARPRTPEQGSRDEVAPAPTEPPPPAKSAPAEAEPPTSNESADGRERTRTAAAAATAGPNEPDDEAAATTETAETTGTGRAPAAPVAARAPPAPKPAAGAAPRQARPLIEVARSAPLAEALDIGYRALREGDLAAADTAYGRAHRLAPDNRDALLGLAAVRQTQGAHAIARRLYRQVLAAYPRDPYARAALTTLDGGTPRRDETELKMLLRDTPNMPALNFALGNLYAAERRWSDARQAYARAAQGAPRDADYAYNLAIALDHLGHQEAAHRAYERALRLADGPAIPDFDPVAVYRRLQRLR